MIYLLMLILIVAVIALIGYGISSIAAYKTNSQVRASKEKDITIGSLKYEVSCLKVRELMATDALNKITADYTHNPALEARLALDDMRAHEIKELSTK